MEKGIRRFRIATLGCKVNQYESFAIKELFLENGFEESGRDCDLVVINTCAVTNSACHQSRQLISKLKRENPNAKIFVTGCYVDLYPSELQGRFPSAMLVPTRYKLDIFKVAERGEVNVERLNSSCFPIKPPTPSERARAYLKIQDGCEGRCTYCVVPLARGSYKSLEKNRVLEQVTYLEKMGYREVVLTGIHLGKYGADLGDITIEDILLEILKRSSKVRLRLSSIEPTELSRDLLELVKSSERICKHFHIPLQSGAEKILLAMGREYTSDEYAELIWDIHKLIPDAGIGADVIVGFPGEDEKDFENTYQLIERLPLSYLHVFPFSVRPGTVASSYVNAVPINVIKTRLNLLRSLAEEKKRTFMERQVGNYIKFLPEKTIEGTYIMGHTDNYLLGVMRSTDGGLGKWALGKVRGVEANKLILDYIKAIDY